MTKAVTLRAWFGAMACTVSALSIGGFALAQQQSQDSQDQQEQTSDQENQDRQQQDQDQSQQNQQNQQDQQQRQSDQQSRQQDQTQRDDNRSRQLSDQERSNWPQPNRDGFSQQGTQFDQQQQTTQFGSRSNEQDAGLGVNIISDHGPGIIVTRVYRGTPADQMGIREGDRITQLNGQDVRSVNEFISRIRNMNPGDEVELEVLRNRDERTVRGELESRQEALLLSNRQQASQRWQDDRTSQTGYQESGTYSSQQGRTMRGGDYSNRLSSIEQQVNRLSRELEQIRFALQDLRQSDRGFQQYGTRESQAGYNEYQSGNQTQRYSSRPQSEQWDGRSNQGARQYETYQDGGQQRQFQGSRTNDQSSARDAAEGGQEGPAGITGGRRTRPDSDLDRLDR